MPPTDARIVFKADKENLATREPYQTRAECLHSPVQRERFYTSLAHFRQPAPFATKSALVVQTVIEAARAVATAAGDARTTHTSGVDLPTQTDLHMALSWRPGLRSHSDPDDLGSAHLYAGCGSLYF